jgi:hypothetical protein
VSDNHLQRKVPTIVISLVLEDAKAEHALLAEAQRLIDESGLRSTDTASGEER